jgi:hypothetical protein
MNARGFRNQITILGKLNSYNLFKKPVKMIENNEKTHLFKIINRTHYDNFLPNFFQNLIAETFKFF